MTDNKKNLPGDGGMILGSWGYPDIGDPRIAAQVKAMGFDSASHGGDREKRAALAGQGILTNACPGRPGAAELLAGLDLQRSDLDQMSDGRLAGEGVNISSFHPAVLRRYMRHISEFVKNSADDENIRSYMLSSPISLYGESHYTISLEGGHMVFSRPAIKRYQAFLKRRYGTIEKLNAAFLKRRYGTIEKLNAAFSTPYRDFESVLPPTGPENSGGEGLDTRPEWAVFTIWYNRWMDAINGRSLEAARKHTDKPLGLMLGGPKAGFIQGVACGHIGPVVKSIVRRGAGFLSDTDSQTLFSVKYTRAACAQYGAALQIEHTGPPYLEPFHQFNTFINTLASGPEILHLAHRGELFEEGGWFRDVYTRLTPILKKYRTRPEKNPIAFFHSYITAMFRTDSSNADVVTVYDRTNKIWFPTRPGPSFARALGNPDVIDDVMIEDGALDGRKLLIIPNTSVTVTSSAAAGAIRRWVKGGGTLLCFGEGCLAYIVGRDGILRKTPGVAGMAKQGNRITKSGLGKIIFIPESICPFDETSAKTALDVMVETMGSLGLEPACRVAGSDDLNLIDCGTDALSGRHIFALDCIAQVHPDVKGARFRENKVYTLRFRPPLRGEAEILGITDSDISCSYKPVSDADAGCGNGSDSDAGVGCGNGSDSDAGVGCGNGSDSDAGAGCENGPYSDAGAGCGNGSDSNAGAGCGNGSDSDTGAPGCGNGSDSDAGAPGHVPAVTHDRDSMVFTIRINMPCEIEIAFGASSGGVDWDSLDPTRAYPTYLP